MRTHSKTAGAAELSYQFGRVSHQASPTMHPTMVKMSNCLRTVFVNAMASAELRGEPSLPFA